MLWRQKKRKEGLGEAGKGSGLINEQHTFQKPSQAVTPKLSWLSCEQSPYLPALCYDTDHSNMH